MNPRSMSLRSLSADSREHQAPNTRARYGVFVQRIACVFRAAWFAMIGTLLITWIDR
jgi:hypothetical protein